MIDEPRQRVPLATASTKAASGLFFLMAIIWGIFGINSLLRGTSVGAVLAALMFVNAAFFLWAGWGIHRRKKRFYFLGIVVLALNIVLTITDQMGFYDWATLCIDLAALIFLIVTRSRYLTKA
jgi:uncharacterized membrane protein (DUF2068 family)